MIYSEVRSLRLSIPNFFKTLARVSFVFATVLVFCTGGLDCQITVGTIVGTATAPDGAAVQGASVTVINEGTNAKRTTVTDQQGSYAVPDLNPGSYTIVVSAPGFATLRNTDVVLSSQQTARVDAPLKVGGVSTQVVVTVGQQVLNTQMASISTTLTPTEIKKSSTNLLGTFDPTGDSGTLQFQYTLPASSGPDGSYSIYGTRSTEDYYNTDGISANSVLFGNNVGPVAPSFDMIQEVRVDTVNSNAEFGQPLTFTIITKSGTNQFHGDVFDHNSNDALSAQNYFSTSKGSFNLNNFGAGLSGPIWKNKLLFFAAFEGLIENQPIAVVSSFPTLAMRTGDFSQLLTGPHPIAIKNPYTNQPFSTPNVIPANLQNSGSIIWQNMFYPAPNFGPPTSIVGNFRATYPQTYYNNRYDLRLDANTSSSNTVFVRFSYDRAAPEALDSGFPPSIVGYRIQTRKVYSGVLSDTWLITPNLINVGKIGAMHSANPENIHGPLQGQPILDKVGIQGFPPAPTDAGGVPAVSLSNFTSPSIFVPLAPIELTVHFIDQLTYQHNNHTFKTGFEYRPQQGNSVFFPNFGSFTFNGSQSGFDYADFLLGLPQATSYTYTRPTQYTRLYFLSAFLQDDWRITPNLVLSYGIRYDYDKPGVDKYDTVSSFDPATGAIIVPSLAIAQKYMNPEFPPQIPIESADQAGYPRRSLRNGFPYALYPRIGFAYTIGKNTVIRGGYGVFNDRLGGQLFGGLYQAPYGGTVRYPQSLSNGTNPSVPCSLAAPCTPSITFTHPVSTSGKLGSVVLTSFDLNLRNPYVQQANLTVERNIGFYTSLRVSYIGTFASDLLYRHNINQVHASTIPFNQANTPYPLYQTLYRVSNGGLANYNSFTAEVNHHMRKSLLFEAALTWAKYLTDDVRVGGGEQGPVIEDAYNLHRQWGNDQWNPRVQFVSNLIWTLPVGPGGWILREDNLWSKILGGWELSTGYFQHTGQYLRPTFSGADPSNTNQFSGTADRIGDPAPIGKRTINNWFNPKAYAIPKNGTFGNAGFGTLEGPGSAALNAAIYKTFAMPKKTALEFSASFTNVLNHPNFSPPDVNITDAAAGKITSTTQQFGSGTGDSPWVQARAGLLSVRYSF